MNYTYYIYHIPGVKIGCTTDLENRMSAQGFTSWEILWQHEGDYEFGCTAGDKEIELQKEYGLPVDTIHYMVSRENRPKGRNIGYTHTKDTKVKISNSHKGKKLSKEHKQKISLGGKGIPHPKTKKHIENHRTALKAIPKLECPYCGKFIGGGKGNLTQHLSKHKKG